MQKYWIKENDKKYDARLVNKFDCWHTFEYIKKGRSHFIFLSGNLENQCFGKIDEPDLYPVFKDEEQLVQQLNSNVELRIDR